jgi:large subunit ribosomal protein L18
MMMTLTHTIERPKEDAGGGTRGSAAQKLSSNASGATAMGAIFWKRAVDAGIRTVVSDRGGRRYHGCVKAFADAVRGAGLEF